MECGLKDAQMHDDYVNVLSLSHSKVICGHQQGITLSSRSVIILFKGFLLAVDNSHLLYRSLFIKSFALWIDHSNAQNNRNQMFDHVDIIECSPKCFVHWFSLVYVVNKEVIQGM